jgi:DNA-binding transcriptional MocR family regulator
LADAGCAEVIEEIESGVKARDRLVALLARLTEGDELVAKSLDRLGRRAGELVVLLDEQYRRLRRDFHDRVLRAAAVIAETFPAETRLTLPSGGFLPWVELPDHVDAAALQQVAIDVGPGAAPGTVFSASGQYGNFIRINVAMRDVGQMAQALAALGEHVQSIRA